MLFGLEGCVGVLPGLKTLKLLSPIKSQNSNAGIATLEHTFTSCPGNGNLQTVPPQNMLFTPSNYYW